MNRKGLRADIYIRLSTEDQVQGEYHSLEHQLDRCRAKIRQMGWLEGEVYSDRGYSARSSRRPDWERLQKNIKAGRTEAVVIFKMERLARNALDGLTFLKLLEEKGVPICSATESLDLKTPQGILSVTYLLGSAEYESRNNGAKVRSKRQENAKRGFKNGGRYPMGYQPSEKKGVPEIEPALKEIIVELFERVAAGESLKEIEVDFHRRDILTPRYRVRRRGGELAWRGGIPLRTDRMAAMIRNPIYKGIVAEGDIVSKGVFEPIVSEELWAAANRKVQSAQQPAARRVRQQDKWFHPLRNLLFCGKCGATMTPRPCGKLDSTGKPYRYYSCSRSATERGGCTSTTRQIPADLLEGIIFKYLGTVADHSAVVGAICSAANGSQEGSLRRLKKKLRSHEKELQTINQQLTNLKEVARTGGTSGFSRMLMKEANDLNAQRNGILAEIHHIRAEIVGAGSLQNQEERVRTSLKSFGKIVESLPEKERRELVGLMISSVKLYPIDSRKCSAEPGYKRSVRIQIELRIGTLLGEETKKRERKTSVTMDADIFRARGLWAKTTGPVELEIHRPLQPRERLKTVKTRHEIHKADQFAQMMVANNWRPADLARSQNLSRAAVAHILKWHELADICRDRLRGLQSPQSIRRISRAFRAVLLKMNSKDQIQALEDRLKKSKRG